MSSQQNIRETGPAVDILGIIRKYWGFDALRPLQDEAIQAALNKRDSLVVMPTGGGKSLCYQAPALACAGLTVIVSPLISLMKDQVDALLACGAPAAQINSAQTEVEQRKIEKDVLQGKLRLLFVSPERIATPRFRKLLEDAGGARAFAIDEAHCISHWGHDFRPEYRQLAELRDRFPAASFHAFTATATARVRRDIADQLRLRDPAVLVGSFDRPNLTYRITSRRDQLEQVEEVLKRHAGEAGIIYCIRRRDVDELSGQLIARKYRAAPYHAGLPPEERKATQEAFSKEECDVVVATVAFGMGIDRSNVRFVLHTGLPKSVEHYQQETGRAGRDGLDAECVLLYSPSDVSTWRSIIGRRPREGEREADPPAQQAALRLLDEVDRYAMSQVCRHRALVAYFGERYEKEACGACDVCLADREALPDSQVIAQKIISCVIRLKEGFGARHVLAVLRGSNTARVRSWRHERLSTFGILSAASEVEIRDWIAQLVALGLLRFRGGEYPVLCTTDRSRAVLRGTERVILLAAKSGTPSDGPREVAWDGVDHPLFELLRSWRKKEADARQVPPFTICSDATLRQLATARPSSLERLRSIYGMAEMKIADFGATLLRLIRERCESEGLAFDVPLAASARSEPNHTHPVRQAAYAAFRRGASVEMVAARTGRAPSTVSDYLADFVRLERPVSVSAWVPDDLYEAVAAHVGRSGAERLKSIHEAMGGSLTYNQIRIVLQHLKTREPAPEGSS